MSLAEQAIGGLKAAGLTVAAAESCTGGAIAAALTQVAGASEVFGYGVVTYSNQAKTKLLQVEPELLAEQGAVSQATARAMAQGALELSGADIAVAVTGIAGPGGGSPDKPVGLVYVACGRDNDIQVRRCQFDGGREQVRRQTVDMALTMLLQALAEQAQLGDRP